MRINILTVMMILMTSLTVNAQEPKPAIDLTTSVITVENVNDLTLLASFDLPNVTTFNWSPDGSKLLVETYEGVWLLEIASMELKPIELDKNTEKVVAFLPNQQIVGRNRTGLFVYDLETSRITQIFPTASFLSDDGSLYAAIDIERSEVRDVIISQTIRVYDVRQNQIVHEIPVTLYNEVCFYACEVAIGFSPDNTQLAFIGAFPEIESAFVNLTTGEKQSMALFGHWGLVYSPDGSLIATTAGTPGYGADALLLFDTQTAKSVTHLKFFSSSSPDFSASGELLGIGAYSENAPNPDEASGFVYIFDVSQILFRNEFTPIAALPLDDPPTAIAFSPDDRFMVISDGHGSFSLWGIQH